MKTNNISIRDEQPGDIDAIFALTEAAFKPMPFSNGSEPHIINALRADGDLTLSLVAQQDGKIIGQITFSPVKISGLQDCFGQDWYGLGPVAAAPDLQKQGIGSALINEGLNRLKARRAHGCVLIGDPNYYSRFGFRASTGSSGLTYGDLPKEVVQWLSFGDDVPTGEITYAQGFGGT